MRLCSGCQRKVPDGVQFCEECRAERGKPMSDGIAEHHSAGRGTYDAELDKLNQGARWHSVRASVLQANPVCARCQLIIAKEVDHIVPADVAIQQARDSGLYPYDRHAGYYLKSNLQGLCRRCHAVKTLEDKSHVGPWPDVIEKERLSPKKIFSF